MRQQKLFQCLLWAMCQPKTFYVLGAGASYGLIPVTQEMRRIIESDFHSVGVYHTTQAPHSQLFERIFDGISSDEQDIQKLLLRHMPLGALDLLAQRALWRPTDGIIPPQYAVFDFVGAPATLCNFNLDGLASAYCGRRHRVLEMHGRIDALRFERMDYKDLLEAAVVYGVQFPYLTPKLMPQPEVESIIFQPEYMRASKLFRDARAVVILGYSFGQRKNGFDDKYSFQYLTSLLRSNPCPVFVISLAPYELVELLRDTLSWRYVLGIPLRWEVFANALMINADPLHGMGEQWLRTNSDRIFRSYEMALDVS